ncbi:MAG TPA: (2Fe-2S)-binding protein [Streptosporangiaceae bacterium]|nr:(2Fe-2S)-binding protein [Streptosporangiaceae bacterium]
MSDERTISFTLNGSKRSCRIRPRVTLADLLRDQLDCTGVHLGCEQGVCGACTVLVNGRTARSCLMLGVQAEGVSIRTIEGLAGAGGGLHPVQQAFSAAHALQCGFCTPGMILAAVELLGENPAPSQAQIREALSGNLCRCTGYANIVSAVGRAAETLRETRAPEATSGPEAAGGSPAGGAENSRPEGAR